LHHSLKRQIKRQKTILFEFPQLQVLQGQARRFCCEKKRGEEEAHRLDLKSAIKRFVGACVLFSRFLELIEVSGFLNPIFGEDLKKGIKRKRM
jgi:hypothetical protein